MRIIVIGMPFIGGVFHQWEDVSDGCDIDVFCHHHKDCDEWGGSGDEWGGRAAMDEVYKN